MAQSTPISTSDERQHDRITDESTNSGQQLSIAQPISSDPQVISIEAWVASKDPYRVVAVGHARPLSKRRIPASDDFPIDLYEKQVQPYIKALLDHHEIVWTTFQVEGYRRREVQDHDDHPKMQTFLVEATNEDPSVFKAAASEILTLFQAAGIGEDLIEVEIRNSDLLTYNVSSVVPNDPILVPAVEKFKASAVELVVNSGVRWNLIAYHMRGPYRRPEAPGRRTVMVYCDHGSVCDFAALESALQTILSPIGWSVEIQFGGFNK
ncbi:hypothetical protein MMC27_006211 [Xylographa pallens]|nr:hypothetical protein [Xylographa pallens]